MMNQALRNALDGYFYGDYEGQRDGEEVLQADRACYECMDVIKGESLFSEWKLQSQAQIWPMNARASCGDMNTA
ncbi:MAG: hypothetical protein HFE76_14105 [Firmicutes bacterium]|nr:hypothetical protein [Bacillota bacterium]